MLQRLRLLHLLDDGEFHTREELITAMALRPRALAVLLEQVRDDGIVIQIRNGSEYALDTAIEWLSETQIRKALKPAAAQCFKHIEVLDSVDSTSRRLNQYPVPVAGQATVCLAEAQSSGRGRLGREWHSPPAVNLYLSLNWRFEAGAQAVQGLSLALGVAVAEACEALGASAIGLKWPNDLVCAQGKLGGILIELGQAAGPQEGMPVCAIIGIGINVNMSGRHARIMDQATADLRSLNGGSVSRNQLAAEVLNAVQQVLVGYALEGLSPYRERWQRRDVMRQQQVMVRGEGRAIRGTALGIDARGAYQLDTLEGTVAITAGTLRLSSEL